MFSTCINATFVNVNVAQQSSFTAICLNIFYHIFHEYCTTRKKNDEKIAIAKQLVYLFWFSLVYTANDIQSIYNTTITMD